MSHTHTTLSSPLALTLNAATVRFNAASTCSAKPRGMHTQRNCCHEIGWKSGSGSSRSAPAAGGCPRSWLIADDPPDEQEFEEKEPKPVADVPESVQETVPQAPVPRLDLPTGDEAVQKPMVKAPPPSLMEQSKPTNQVHPPMHLPPQETQVDGAVISVAAHSNNPMLLRP
eukprot:6459635-Amphidinium_carterae.2